MRDKKISIVVPIYNSEKYLNECLDSLYRLDLSNKEIILVNDGSTDNSLKIAKEYYKKYRDNTKLISQENQGLSEARNTGINSSEGEYLFFLDSDDFVNSENLEKFLQEGIEKKQDILIGNYYHYYTKSQKTELKKYSEKLLNIYNKPGDFFLIEGVKEKAFTEIVCRNLFKKEFLIKNTLYFEKGLLHEDTLFTLQAYRLAQKVGYSKEKIYYYRQDNPNSIMRNLKEKNYVHMMYILNKLIKFQENLGNENKYFNKILISVYWKVVKNGKLKNKTLFKEIIGLKFNFKEKLKLIVIFLFSSRNKEIENINKI